jgi:hypothetical protein
MLDSIVSAPTRLLVKMLLDTKLGHEFQRDEYDFLCNRSRRLYSILNYNFLIFPVTLATCFYRTSQVGIAEKKKKKKN